MVDDLPFPHPRTQYNAKWQKLFRLTLLSWASTFPDLYATNTLLDETILLEMWDIIYPDIDLDKEDRMDAGVKLIYLVCALYAVIMFLGYRLLPGWKHSSRLAYHYRDRCPERREESLSSSCQWV
jgi:hypothetical protein